MLSLIEKGNPEEIEDENGSKTSLEYQVEKMDFHTFDDDNQFKD